MLAIHQTYETRNQSKLYNICKNVAKGGFNIQRYSKTKYDETMVDWKHMTLHSTCHWAHFNSLIKF